MKKITLFLMLFILLFVTSCVTNTNYTNNKRILEKEYSNSDYAILTYSGYETNEDTIDFKKIIKTKINSDGKNSDSLYSTRYKQTLIGDNLYFCYEYKYTQTTGFYAIGYVDFNTLEVYLDYCKCDKSAFNYEFSTKDFICYSFKNTLSSNNVKYAVFFKETNELKFDYNINLLEYTENEKEQEHVKDYYIENGIKYKIEDSNTALINTEDGSIINLPYQNDILDKVPLLKGMYEKFTYDKISITVTYISTGDELFFCIHDRPTNKLNVPLMIFKCSLDFSNVEYVGYSDERILDVICLK